MKCAAFSCHCGTTYILSGLSYDGFRLISTPYFQKNPGKTIFSTPILTKNCDIHTFVGVEVSRKPSLIAMITYECSPRYRRMQRTSNQRHTTYTEIIEGQFWVLVAFVAIFHKRDRNSRNFTQITKNATRTQNCPSIISV